MRLGTDRPDVTTAEPRRPASDLLAGRVPRNDVMLGAGGFAWIVDVHRGACGHVAGQRQSCSPVTTVSAKIARHAHPLFIRALPAERLRLRAIGTGASDQPSIAPRFSAF